MIDQHLLSARQYTPNPPLSDHLLHKVIDAKATLSRRCSAKNLRSQHLMHFRFDDRIWVVAHQICWRKHPNRATPATRRHHIVILHQPTIKHQTPPTPWAPTRARRLSNPHPYHIESLPDPNLVIIFNSAGAIVHGEDIAITPTLDDTDKLPE
jgi:hypothetical protein